MKFCAVQGCYSNDTYDDVIKRRFFMFPNDSERADLWQNFTCDLKRKYNNTPKKLYICDRHFAQSDYDSGARLKETAVPSRNGPTAEVIQLAENPIPKRRGRPPKNVSALHKTPLKVAKKLKKSKAKLKSCLNPASSKATALSTILHTNGVQGVTPDNRVVEVIQLDAGSEPNSQMGDHNYTAANNGLNNDNLLVLTPVTEPPDFIKKKVEELMQSQMIAPNTIAPKLLNSVKYDPNHAKKNAAEGNILNSYKSTKLPIVKNISDGITEKESDLSEIIPSKISSGLMVPIDSDPITFSEEVTTTIHAIEDKPIEENYEDENIVQDPKHQMSQKEDANYSILLQNYPKLRWNSLLKQSSPKVGNVVLESKHRELREQDKNDSLLVEFNTYIREKIDKYLEEQKVTEENLYQINKDVEIMSEASDDSVVYLVVGDDFAERDNTDNNKYEIKFANYPDDYASPLNSEEISSYNNTTKELKTTSNHNGSKIIIDRTKDSETSSAKSKEDNMSVAAETTAIKNVLLDDDNGVIFIDLEPSLNSPVEERNQPRQSASEREVNKGLETSSGSATRSYFSGRKYYRNRTVLNTKCLMQNKTIIARRAPSNEMETEKTTSSGVNINKLSSSDKSMSFSREITEEQFNKVDLDTYLPMMPVDTSSPVEGIIDDTVSADESCHEPATADKNFNRKTFVMREHLKRIKELSRKKMIRKYPKPKFPKRRKLLRSKYSIAALAESLGTFNCHAPKIVQPVDLERVPEWHKLYMPSMVSKSFPRLNEAYISKMVNHLKARLPSLEPRDQLEVSFLLSVMSAYPGAPEYVKELLTQRLNMLYIATLFQWDTALALAARGHNEFGPITDPTVPSIPLTKFVPRKRGVKNPRPNPKYYSPKWNTDGIVVPEEAVKPPTFAFEVIVQQKNPNEKSRGCSL